MSTEVAPTALEPVTLRIRLQPWMAAVVLVATIAFGFLGYLTAESRPPSQVASIDLLVLPNTQGDIDEALVRTFQSTLRADSFAAEVNKSANGTEASGLSGAEIAASITTRRSPTSSLIKVQVTRPDSESATAIAELITPTMNRLLTAGGADASTIYRQVFPEPIVREVPASSSSLAVVLGGFLGFVLGVLGVLTWSSRHPVLRTIGDVQEISGYPVIARLPSQARWWRRHHPNRLDPLVAAVEQVRETGLMERGGVVAVVSPEADSLTTFSIEFASLLAQAGKRRVFLVDGDYRRADLTHHLDAADQGGWDRLNLDALEDAGLSDEMFESLLPVTSPFSGIAGDAQALFVPVGQLGVEQDAAMLDQLSSVLHIFAAEGVVVVACPPIPGDVPAAPTFASASATLIVTRLGVTSPTDLELAGEMVAALSEAPAGVVVIDEGPG